MANGVPPSRIAFVTFTRKGAAEAVERACEKFGFKPAQLPYFRTCHSLAFQQLGVNRSEVLSTKHYREIGNMLGLTFSNKLDLIEEGVPTGQFDGDQYVFLHNFARARCMSFEDAWHEVGGDNGLNWFEFKRFNEALTNYKRRKHLIDFSDMLENCKVQLDVDVVFIDEAQDLSRLQWEFASSTFATATRIYIAGDDDQGIYQWSGADVQSFIDMPGRRDVLKKSYRFGRAIHSVAMEIVDRISVRIPKAFGCKDEEGAVEYHRQPDDVDFTEGSWLLLARNVYMLQQLVKVVRNAGIPYLYRGEPAINQEHVRVIQLWEMLRKGKAIPSQDVKLVYDYLKIHHGYTAGSAKLIDKLTGGMYTIQELQEKYGLRSSSIWHEALLRIPDADREFYISLLRKGEKLNVEPRISINTIHGVKGGEADNVLLLTDISNRTYEGMQTDPDSEHRVFYVGVTRARKVLHVVEPQTRCCYEI